MERKSSIKAMLAFYSEVFYSRTSMGREVIGEPEGLKSSREASGVQRTLDQKYLVQIHFRLQLI